MASLAAHTNVWGTCLQLLERKGFRLHVALGEDECVVSWFAERGDIELQADDPISLLGLAAIYEDLRPERHEPYWWSRNTRKDDRVEDRLICEAEEQERNLLCWRERPEWRRDVEAAWRDAAGSLEEAADQLGITVRILKVILNDLQLLT